MSVGFGLVFVIGGALHFARARAGFFWIAGGDIAYLVAVVYSAWVLMVEILHLTLPTAIAGVRWRASRGFGSLFDNTGHGGQCARFFAIDSGNCRPAHGRDGGAYSG